MYQIRRFLAADAGGAPGAGAGGAPGAGNGAEGAAAPGATPATGGEAAATATGATTQAKPSLEELLKDPAFKAEYEKSTKTEAERLAKLTEDERAAEEKKAFDTEREQFRREQLEAETVKQLALKGLPVDLAKQLTGKDAVETLANITAFEKAHLAAVEKTVNERLKGTTPRTGSGSAATGSAKGGGFMAAITDAQFKR